MPWRRGVSGEWHPMMTLLEALSPLAGGVNAALVLVSVLTSAVTAAVGVGGGLLMIMAMAQVMPAAALIPVQGLGGPKARYSCYSR